MLLHALDLFLHVPDLQFDVSEAILKLLETILEGLFETILNLLETILEGLLDSIGKPARRSV
jgi:hypothetical protein